METNKPKLILIPLNVKTITELMKRIYLSCSAISINKKRIRNKQTLTHTHSLTAKWFTKWILLLSQKQQLSYCHWSCWMLNIQEGCFSTNYYYYSSKMYASFLKYKIPFLSHCSASIGEMHMAFMKCIQKSNYRQC